MSTSVVRPEDVLPDGVDSAVIEGRTVRKGSVAAFIANARILAPLQSGTPAYEQVVDQLQILAPVRGAIGLFEIFEFRSPELRKLLSVPTSTGQSVNC